MEKVSSSWSVVSSFLMRRSCSSCFVVWLFSTSPSFPPDRTVPWFLHLKSVSLSPSLVSSAPYKCLPRMSAHECLPRMSVCPIWVSAPWEYNTLPWHLRLQSQPQHRNNTNLRECLYTTRKNCNSSLLQDWETKLFFFFWTKLTLPPSSGENQCILSDHVSSKTQLLLSTFTSLPLIQQLASLFCSPYNRF